MPRDADPAIPVHLLDLPRMLDDTVRVALAGDEFELTDGPPQQHPAAGPTVVVMQARAGRRPWLEQLERRPYVSVLLIDARGLGAELIELQPLRRSLGTLDAAALAAAVRSAVGWQDRAAGSGAALTP
jgi:hypothetical protein